MTWRRCLAAWVACGAAVALHAAAAPGPSVALAGQMGSKALLVIDGQPQIEVLEVQPVVETVGALCEHPRKMSQAVTQISQPDSFSPQTT